MAKILVVRLSALGDVAMLVPVLASVAEKYPQDRFFIMTRVAFAPLFNNLSFNVNVIPLDMNGKHKGFFGLLKIINKCVFMGFSHVADVHDVLRSKLVRWAVMLTGRKVRHLNKGKADKRHMIETKVLRPALKPTTERYMDVFVKLGFPANITFSNLLDFAKPNIADFKSIVGEKTGRWIGIAPFARHGGKMYPMEKMEKVVEMLSKEENTTVLLLGAGKEEKSVLDTWAGKYSHVISLAGKFKLDKEIQIMSFMDVVVSMDSANMHLASLVQVPVVSIWGATDPSIGFYGFRQDLDNALHVELPCRPCSIFGDQPCIRPQLDCMLNISEQAVVDKIHSVLIKHKK